MSFLISERSEKVTFGYFVFFWQFSKLWSDRVGFYPGKNYFFLSGGKKLEISGKTGGNGNFREKNMLSLLYLKMNVIKWHHSCNVG